MRISKGTYKAAKYACLHFHYSKSVPAPKFIYNVFNDDNEWCGVIIYGLGATPNIAKPFNKIQGECIELVRVALNGKQGHGNTSRALSMTIKALKKEAPYIDLIVSFADVDQNHAGTLYQATNWIYAGTQQAGAQQGFIINGKYIHNKSCHSRHYKQSLEWLRNNVDANAEKFITKGKHKYLYPMNKKTRKEILKLSRPYPKNADVVQQKNA